MVAVTVRVHLSRLEPGRRVDVELLRERLCEAIDDFDPLYVETEDGEGEAEYEVSATELVLPQNRARKAAAL